MGNQLAKPSSLSFIIGSIFFGLLLNIFPWGNHFLVPDWLMIVLVFWNLHEPRKVGIVIAFFLGLLIDVQSSSLLGIHSISYCIVAYVAIAWHRRILDLKPIAQAFHLFPIFLIPGLIDLLLFLWVQNGQLLSALPVVIPCLIQALLWPIASWLLTTPQRRQNASVPL